MSLPHESIDPDGLLEYSVVFTDHSLNHMSARFVGVMQETIDILRSTYNAHSAAVVPGGGTYAMEAVARQLAGGRRCLIVRNGLFSYRWSQVLQVGRITEDVTVCTARQVGEGAHAPWAPAPVEEVTAAIRAQKPELVFAPHVETASGIVLSEEYVRALAEATHAAGGLFVLDCIASGALWVDMVDLGVDLLLTAPQKGWSGSPCAGHVLFSKDGYQAVQDTETTSFAADLKKWLFIAEEYRAGRAPYHATMPTDSLTHNVRMMRETTARGLQGLRMAQIDLGARVRDLLADRGLPSVAAPSVASPTVVVSYTDDPQIRTGAAFARAGVQVAAGVPLQCGEGEDFSTFRIGLFGLDKLSDVDGTVERFAAALDQVA